jgi:uncharacterized protein YuzE
VKLSYFADTDSLYIDLSDEASKRVQMDKLVLSQLPSTVETAAA